MDTKAKVLFGIVGTVAAALGLLGMCAVSLFHQERAEVGRVVPLERLPSEVLFASFASAPPDQPPPWLEKPVQVHGTIVRVESPAFPGPAYVYLDAGDGAAVVCSIPATVFALAPLLEVGEPAELSGICDAWFPAESIVALKDCAVVEAR